MRFNRNLRYIYNETQPFFVTPKIFQEFWKIFPTYNLKLIYGREIDQKVPDETAVRLYNVLILIEVCHNFYPIIFLKQLYSKRINVRYALLTLNALKFPLRLFMEVCGHAYDTWIQFIDQIADLRERWFELERREGYHSLERMLHEAAIVSIDLTEKLHTYIEQELWKYKLASNKATPSGIKFWDKYFIPVYDRNEVLEITLNDFVRNAKWTAYLPSTFYYPLTVYRLVKGVVSDHIAKFISDDRELFAVKDDSLPAYMQDRISLMNDHAAFYKENNVLIKMVHHYYGYMPPTVSGKSSLHRMKPYRFLKKIVGNGWL